MTMNRNGCNRSKSAGFSLIEMMIALVAGLIVVGAVLAFTLSSLESNTQLVQSARLTEELRNTTDYVSRELRRAGYDETAMSYYSQPATVVSPTYSPFSAMLVSGNCIIYAYDRQPPSTATTAAQIAAYIGVVNLAQGEIRGIRLASRPVAGKTVGVIEVAESSSGVTPDCGGGGPTYTNYPATCNTTSNWCPLSDGRVVDITSFSIDSTSNINAAAVSNGTPLAIRSLKVTIVGNLVSAPSITRTMSIRIKVRADCLRYSGTIVTGVTMPNCNVTPTGT